MLEALAGLILFALFIGVPALTIFGVLYYCNHGTSPFKFKFQLWRHFNVPMRALIPSLLTKILGKVRQAAAHGEMKLHEKTVEGTIKETRAWHGDLTTMQDQLAGLGLSAGTMDEFKGKVDTVKSNGDNLQEALDLHRQTQARINSEQQSVSELEALLANMRALHMSPGAIQEVEAKLLTATIKASQTTVASQVIAGYLGTHATLPGGMVQSLPVMLNDRQVVALPNQQIAAPALEQKAPGADKVEAVAPPVPVADQQVIAPPFTTPEQSAAPVKLAKGAATGTGTKTTTRRRTKKPTE